MFKFSGETNRYVLRCALLASGATSKELDIIDETIESSLDLDGMAVDVFCFIIAAKAGIKPAPITETNDSSLRRPAREWILTHPLLNVRHGRNKGGVFYNTSSVQN